MSVSRSDIHQHVVLPALGGEFDAEMIDAIEDAVIDAAPLDSWRLDGLDYVSDVLDAEGFRAIVERVAEAA